MKIVILLACVGMSLSGPTLYKVNGQAGEAEEIRIPVSSTVIPLDDLPELEVGFGFGLADKTKAKKPNFLKDIKLITSKNKHRFVAPAGVQRLTQEEFELFANRAKAF